MPGPLGWRRSAVVRTPTGSATDLLCFRPAQIRSKLDPGPKLLVIDGEIVEALNPDHFECLPRQSHDITTPLALALSR